MSETNLSRRLVKKVKHQIDVWHRIENGVEVGTPDVYYAVSGHGGWVELKHVHEYPRMPTTPIRFKRFTLEQVDTIETFGQSCGWSWVLIQIELHHYLFHWDRVRELQIGQPRSWWEDNAYKIWTRPMDYKEFVSILSKGLT